MSSSLRPLALVTVMAFSMPLTWANDTPKEKTPQQNRMAQCNQDAKAKALKGDERKAFMKQCLSNKPAVAAATDKPATAQSSKMKTCNDQAKGKKGDERKAFMAECLKA